MCVYVADTKNNCVKKYDSNGNLVLNFGQYGTRAGQFVYPYDVAVDFADKIYVADTGNHRIQKFDKQGQFITEVCSMGQNVGQVIGPRGLYMDNLNGYLYVVSADEKVQQFDVSVHINDIKITNATFSPNGDGIAEKSTIDYSPSENALLNLDVFDGNDALINILIDQKEIGSGQNSVIWDGKDEKGKIVPDGEYHYILSGATKDGIKDVLPITGVITVDTTPPVVDRIAVDPNPFTPNGDGIDDSTSIKFHVSEPSDVYIKIKDSDGNIFQEAKLTDVQPNMENSFAWDGKSKYGEIKEGEYSTSIKAVDMAGNESADVTGPTVMADTSQFLFYVYASPEVLSNSSNVQRPIEFHLRVVSPCSIEGYITSSSIPVRSMLPLTEYSPGEYVVQWDGRDDNGTAVKEGNYSYIFSALAPNNTFVKKGTVRVDNTSPYVSRITLQPSEESVKALNALAGEFVLSYYLSERSKVSLDIVGPEGIVVSNILSDQIQETAENSLSFSRENFKVKGSFEPGEFTIRFTLVDEAGNIYTDESARLNILSGLAIANVSEDPPTFTPNKDNHDDFANIKYTVLGGGTNVTSRVVIKTPAGATIKTFNENNANGAYLEVWDGRDEMGNQAPDGQYQYEVSVTDSDGSGPAPVTGNVNLVRSPTIVMYADPLAFSPNGDGFMDTTKFYYTINYLERLMEGDSHINIDITDQSGNKVYHFADTKPEGSYYQIWDASNNVVGGYVPDGTYGLQFTASDPSGTLYSYVANLIVDRGPPAISDEGVSAPIITPNGDGQQDETIIRYKVIDVGTQIQSVEVRIYDSKTVFDGTTLVKTLSGSVNGDTVWDGSVNMKGGNGDADNNDYADKGMYKYVIIAEDVLGNIRTYVSSNEIEVDQMHLSVVSPPNSLSEPYFSPNGDGIKDMTSICFYLTVTPEANPFYLQSKGKGMKILSADHRIGKATVKVKNASGETVKVLTSEALCCSDTTYTVSWDGTDSSGIRMPDGTYSIEVTAVDMVGDPATNSVSPTCLIDTVPPVIAFTSPGANFWFNGKINIYGTISDEHPGTYSLGYDGSTINIGSGAGARTNELLASWDATGLAGRSYKVTLFAVDDVGNATEESTYFNVDGDAPIISNIVLKANGETRNYFNPYLDNNITVEFDVDDNSFDSSVYSNPAANIYLNAEVWLGNTRIATLETCQPVTQGLNSVTWNGINSNGNYVNEGEYQVRLSLMDNNNNTKNTMVSLLLKDDQKISNGMGYCNNPYLTLASNNLELSFTKAGATHSSNKSFQIYNQVANQGWGPAPGTPAGNEMHMMGTLHIDSPQQIRIDVSWAASGQANPYVYYEWGQVLVLDSNNNTIFSHLVDADDQGGTYYLNLNKGVYYINVVSHVLEELIYIRAN